MTVRINLNGKAHDLDEEVTVAELLVQLKTPPETVAIEVNEEIVRRADYATTRVTQDDAVEVIRFYPGG